jgi:hypothetical protein
MDYNTAWREWVKHGLDINKCTCKDCEQRDRCLYAYDIYNYEGDCLREK